MQYWILRGLPAIWFLLFNAKGVHTTTNPRIIEHPEDAYVAKNEPATLNCKAEGSPAPLVTWFRNGQPVMTANENPSSHRMLLPSGQLFFLRIIHNKNNKPDVGTYFCNATNPETGVSVVSRNATLEIAAIRDDFREMPRDVDVGIGDTATMTCRGPRGLPEPRVKWKKDGAAMHPHARISVNNEGSLVIVDSRREDSGVYTCVAYNIAGEKESRPARLLVKDKPKFDHSPQDVLVEEGVDVEFNCEANGDPMPTIIWRREEGSIPQGRSSIGADRSLRISRVKVQDEGIYVCRAENTVGHVEALARLTVHSKPSFSITPTDKIVGVGRTVSLRCEVTGNPPPAVYWNKETSQNLMFPRQDHGRFSVSDGGTLVIEPVRKEDSGEYVCQALSVAGSAFAKAKVTVRDVDPRPPPIIHQGPQNQTLPVDSVAMLQCHSSGDPAPAIRWYKNNRPLSERDPRIAILDSGTLQISDLHPSDTGIYTCKALSETGETSWSAALNVESSSNSRVVFHRTPEPSTFPGSPSKPMISEVEESSMKLTWKANSNHGASPISGYMVEYFSHETGEGWVVAADNIRGQTFLVQNLRPDTSYLFLVRAMNTHGMSMPSQVTSGFRTLGGGRPKPVPGDFDISLVAEKLSGQVVSMKTPEVISSTAVKLNWEILKSNRFIEGFHVKYRVMPDIYEHLTSDTGRRRQGDYTVETVDSGTETMYVLRNLRSFTWFEIKVQPFYLSVEGQESQIKRVRTFEDVPSAPPQDVTGMQLNNSTLKLSWRSPPREYHNGPLSGYKIFCLGNETRFHRNITVNATTTTILIQHLVYGMKYKIQVAAKNRKGIGIRSDPYILGRDLAGLHHWAQAPWFIATTIGVIGAALWFCLCIFIIWLCRKKKAQNKLKSGVTMVPVHKTDDPSSSFTALSSMAYTARNSLEPLSTLARLGSYFTSLNAPNYLHKDIANHVNNLPPDVAAMTGDCSKEELLADNLYNNPQQLAHAHPMKTFYNKGSSYECSPYATTTLLTRGLGMEPQPINMGGPLVRAGSESAFRPIQAAGYTIKHGSSQQAVDHSPEANLPPQHIQTDPYTTDQYTYDDPWHGNSLLMQHYNSMCPEEAEARFGPKQPFLFLPPPPEHPPPSEVTSSAESPTGNPGNNACYSMPHGRPPVHYKPEHSTMPPHSTVQDIRNMCNNGGVMPPHSDGEYHPPGEYHQPGVVRANFSPHLFSEARTRSLRGTDPPITQTSCSSPSEPTPPSPKCRTVSPKAVRAYSPRAMSEPERGPTPPVRAYKLVPLSAHTEFPRHYSDTEGASVPPLRMLAHDDSGDPPFPCPPRPPAGPGVAGVAM